jgi:acyl-CoA hydrolase
MNRPVASRPVSFSKTTKTEVVLPNDTNPMGLLQGGRLVEWMDIAAAICAQTHTEQICVTASINNVEFISPAKIGDIITIAAVITRSFSTAMEVFVEAFARKVLAGEKYLVGNAFFTFVGLDKAGKASPVIAVKPVTAAEKNRYVAALKRKNSRQKNKRS